MIDWFVNNELERMWKEMVITSFEALSCHFPGRTEETTRHFSQDSWCPNQESNWVPAR